MADPIKILYVDDYVLDRQLVRDVLKREHGRFQLTEARTGEEFKRCLAAADYDLILSDFNILGYNGLQVLEAVQAKDASLPVIIVTGTGSEEIAVKALKQGAVDYVIKTPEHIRRLPEMIKHVLNNKRLARKNQEAVDQLRFQAAVLENVRDAIQVTDLEGRTIYWNKGAEKIFGYTAAEMMGQTSVRLYPEEDFTQLASDLENILIGQDYRGEWRGRCKDGTPVWIDVLTTVMRNASGEAIGFIGVSKDITKRKQAEEALRQSKERYARAAEAGRVGIWEWNLDTNEIYIDPHLKVMLGYADHEIENRRDDWVQRIHPDDAVRVMYEAQNHIEGLTARYEVEHRMLHKDGHVRWFLAQGMVSRDDTGRAVSMIGSDTDITERKEAELARRESQVQLQLAIQAARVGSWDWDIEANTVYYSAEWKQQLGYADHELSDNFDEWQRRLHPDDRARTMAALQVYLENPWPEYQVEFRIRHKDGDYRWIMSRGTLFIGQAGKSRRMLGLHLDITERKRIELKLQETNERLQAIVQASPLAILALDRSGRVTVWSPAAEQLFGWSAGEVIGQPYPLAPGDKQGEFQQKLRTIWAGQVILGMEIRRQLKDGTLLDLRLDTAPLHDAAGNITGVMAIYTNITNRKRTETALRQSEERLELAVAGSKGGVWELVFNPNERHAMPDEMYISPQLKQLIGFEDDEFPNSMRAWQERILPEDLPHLWTSAEKHLAGKTALYEVEYRIRHKDGSLRWIYSRGKIHRNETGGLRCWSGVDWDITQRKQAEEALQRYADRLQTLHQIDRAILAARSVEETAMAALARLVELVPCQRADVSLFDLSQQTVERIAVYSQGKTTPGQGFQIPVAETLLDLNLLRQGKYQEVEDYQTLDGLPARLQAIITQLGVRAAIVAPLIANNELVGLVGLGRAEPGHFVAEEIDIIREVADQLAIAIRQAWLFEAERDQRELAEALSDTARVLNSTLDVEQVLDDILMNAGRVVPHSAGDVLLVDAKGIVSIARQKKYDRYGQAKWASKRFFPLEDFPVLETIAKSRNSQVIPDTYADPDWVIVPETAWIRSYICAPIFKRKELFGFISLSHTSPDFYTTVHAERLQSFAEQAGFALHNAYLYEQTQRHAQELEQRVAERTAELRAYYRQQAIAEERQRLARDLHDAVSQTLFSAGLLAEAIPRLWERHPEQARRSLEDLRRLNRGALAEMRNLLLELRPAALEEARLAEILRQLVDALTGRIHVETSLQVEDDIAVPAEVQLALYRITQEVLNNIAKHARAGRVEVRLHSQQADQIRLTIRDDGRGFDPQQVPPGHLGLSIMRERAEKIGARLAINSRSGQGTEIVVTWPGD